MGCCEAAALPYRLGKWLVPPSRVSAMEGKMRFAVLFALVMTLSSVAQATEVRTKGGYPACLSEEEFDEAVTAMVNQDEAHFRQLRGCIITRAGLKAVVLDLGFGTTKIRLFTPDGQSMVMWTNTENIR